MDIVTTTTTSQEVVVAAAATDDKLDLALQPSPEDQDEETQKHQLNWTGSTGRNTSYFSTVSRVTTCHDERAPLQFVVVAIDFGTTFSGYAFSFTKDVDSIHVMRKWEGGDPGVTNQKTPTILLLTPEKNFHSFGFTARDFYHDLSQKEAKRWLYFEKFKMALHYNADLTSETEIQAANGVSMKAIDVFAHALKFFRNHALLEISEQSNTPLNEDDIRWVITVPAIWKSPAKQFMRESAYKACIASQEKPDQLIIALEPEAASVFVRRQRLKQLIPEVVDELKDARHAAAAATNAATAAERATNAATAAAGASSPSPTTKSPPFMVADCGGGTVDITVYEMLSATGGQLKEVYKATGGPYGSIGVDLAFEKLLEDIFGRDFIDILKLKRPAGWVDLMMAFESRKRAANPFKTKPLNVSLPFSFIDYHKKFRNSTVESAVRKYNSKYVKWSSQGMLRLMPEAMEALFQPTLDNITAAINSVMSQAEVVGLFVCLFVCLCECLYVCLCLCECLYVYRVKILIPNDVSMAILKGAVIYGIDPSVVVIRKSRLTYGLGVLNRFIEGKHPESKKAIKDGTPWCVDVFDPLVFANQSVALGSSVIRSYTPASLDQKYSLFHIYCSEDRDVSYVTDEGVAKCGTLRLDLDNHQWELESNPREIQARLTFGDTEIKIVALDVATGNYVRATLDFLNK
ncbi:hypothetical protein HELRODRAFT_90361 [Helobdella robusta]|uniref:Uncharacterized protein n=1 Tax=Helobdella robusta TaxID=6412 RepID=T1G7P7_HELRO|nr:hypothetical protein HELRODRAFT_90361 [Helobdella robusta]ESN91198.1 hypothetical protein HELRODRAFT_90361 [Helobdella robusta]